jgi:hypothetical protein
LKLVTTMEDTYSFVASTNELKNQSILQDIVNQILNQTIQCGYFIQQYAQRDFGGKWQLYKLCDEEFI